MFVMFFIATLYIVCLLCSSSLRDVIFVMFFIACDIYIYIYIYIMFAIFFIAS